MKSWYDRAECVCYFLIDAGNVSSHVQAKGYGESLPVVDNETLEGRASNRITEFTSLGF